MASYNIRKNKGPHYEELTVGSTQELVEKAKAWLKQEEAEEVKPEPAKPEPEEKKKEYVEEKEPAKAEDKPVEKEEEEKKK